MRRVQSHKERVQSCVCVCVTWCAALLSGHLCSREASCTDLERSSHTLQGVKCWLNPVLPVLPQDWEAVVARLPDPEGCPSLLNRATAVRVEAEAAGRAEEDWSVGVVG